MLELPLVVGGGIAVPPPHGNYGGGAPPRGGEGYSNASAFEIVVDRPLVVGRGKKGCGAFKIMVV